jgi:hypothetical protein
MEARESERRVLHRGIDGEVAALLGIGGGEVRPVPLIGIRALMLAMLEDAVRAYLGSNARECEEAEAWIDSARNRWVFSFTTVCETLGLEPPAVREALARLRNRPLLERRVRLGKSRPNARQANLPSSRRGGGGDDRRRARRCGSRRRARATRSIRSRRSAERRIAVGNRRVARRSGVHRVARRSRFGLWLAATARRRRLLTRPRLRRRLGRGRFRFDCRDRFGLGNRRMAQPHAAV